MSDAQNNATVNLIRALVQNMSSPDDWGNWESLTMILDSYEGKFNSVGGYVYSPGDTISAVTASPSTVIPFVNEYLDGYYKPGEKLPVKLLVQFHRPTGQYNITFEDTDEERWKVSPRTIKTIRQDLRPTLDEAGTLEGPHV